MIQTGPKKKDFDKFVNKFYIKKTDKSLLNKYTEIVSVFVRQKCMHVKSNIELIKNPYKIVYGHFYNKWNNFIYKKIYRNNIDNTQTYKCKYGELYKEKDSIEPENSLSYSSIKNYVDNLFNKYKENFKQTKYKYSYDNKTLTIERNKEDDITELIDKNTLILKK